MSIKYLVSLLIILNFIFNLSRQRAIAEEPLSEVKSSIFLRNVHSTNQKRKVKKPSFPDRGIPTGRRRGGTSRSSCPAPDTSLTAIVPGKKTEKDNFIGYTGSKSFLTQTIQEYPYFWIYIPELTGFSRQGEFILQDVQDNDIYRTNLALPNIPGILSIKVPSQPRYSLQLGQKYHWYVKLYCSDKNETTEYIFVDAWIERVAATPELEKQLNAENADLYQVFVNNNIWHDAISSLAEARQNNFKTERWKQLLTNLGLPDLIDKNILEVKSNFPTE